MKATSGLETFDVQSIQNPEMVMLVRLNVESMVVWESCRLFVMLSLQIKVQVNQRVKF